MFVDIVRDWLRDSGIPDRAKPAQRARRPAIEGLEERQLLATTLPDIAMVSATTVDSRGVTFEYEVVGETIENPVRFGVYRSADSVLDPGDLLVESRLVGPGAEGTPMLDEAGLPWNAPGRHGFILPLSDGLTPNPDRPFVLVVADPGGELPESGELNNTASFRKRVVGVVTHGGLQPKDWKYGPDWQGRMATGLEEQGYDAVVRFNWVAESRTPGAAAKQSTRLYWAILAAADPFPVSEPVDLHVIGHSEGAVVNGLAVLKLGEQASAPIDAGFLKVTMLDPHAANNAVAGQQYSVSPGLLGWIAKMSIDRFQARAKDPALVVPGNVDEAEVFFQRTPVSESQSNSGIYNLWGQVPVHGPASYFDLTGPGVSHSGTFGVHDWYRLNIVPTLGDGSTFTRENALSIEQAPATVVGMDRGLVADSSSARYLGDAAPGAEVRLIAVRVGSTDLARLGESTARTDGSWELTTRPAPGRYRVKAIADVPGNPTPRLIPNRPIHLRPTAWAEPLVIVSD